MLNTQLLSQEAPDMDSGPISIITSICNPPLPCYSSSTHPPPPPRPPLPVTPPPQFVPLEAETDSLSQATDQERRVSLPLPQEVSGDPQCNLILPTPSPAQGC